MIFGLTCKKAAEHLDLGLEHAHPVTRIRVRVHLFWCRACTAYFRGNRMLAEAAAEFCKHAGADALAEKITRDLLKKYSK